MKTSENIEAISTALAQAQGDFPPIEKNRTNPHFKSAYADISSILKSCRPILSKHGLALVQGIEVMDGRVNVTTRLIHKSGQWKETMLSLKPDRDNAQGVGSTSTYARRYSMEAMLGISATDDDDGMEATKATKEPEKKAPTPEAKGDIFTGDAESRQNINRYLEKQGLLTPVLVSEIVNKFLGKPKSEIVKFIDDKKAAMNAK